MLFYSLILFFLASPFFKRQRLQFNPTEKRIKTKYNLQKISNTSNPLSKFRALEYLTVFKINHTGFYGHHKCWPEYYKLVGKNQDRNQGKRAATAAILTLIEANYKRKHYQQFFSGIEATHSNTRNMKLAKLSCIWMSD